MNGSRPAIVGATLILAVGAIVLSVLVLVARPVASPVVPAASIDLSMLITGRGAIGGPAKSHLFDPQMLVVRRGDTVTLRVLNQSNFRHGIELVGQGVRTKELAGGESDEISFTAQQPGIFEYRCYVPYDPAAGSCSPDHEKMVGHLVVIESAR